MCFWAVRLKHAESIPPLSCWAALLHDDRVELMYAWMLLILATEGLVQDTHCTVPASSKSADSHACKRH